MTLGAEALNLMKRIAAEDKRTMTCTIELLLEGEARRRGWIKNGASKAKNKATAGLSAGGSA
jgi:hypothetical protein